MSGKRVRHSARQIVEKLQDADRLLHSGQSLGQVLQPLGVSQGTYHRWRQRYGGMKASEAKRLEGTRTPHFPDDFPILIEPMSV